MDNYGSQWRSKRVDSNIDIIMEDFQSKYSGEQVEEILDAVANGEAGGGGGGITVETDPVFSASPAASITEAKKAEWDAKQEKITDLDAIRSGAEKGATALQSVPSEYVTETELMWTKAEGEAGVRLKGTNGTATGNMAISAGDDKTASDGAPFTSAASGDHAVAFGYGNTCAGRTTLAQGLYNIVNGNDSVAFGQRNIVNGTQAFAVGQQNEATARMGVAIGYKNKATYANSTAIGYQNTASGSGSVALGDTCESSGTCSTAMGNMTKATGDYSTTFGQNTQATNDGEVAMGVYNKSTTSTDASEQTAFSFGIGTSDTNRANAFEIKKNGDVYIGDKLLSVAYPRITTDLADVALQPNTVTEWDAPISADLALSFAEQQDQGYAAEYIARFSVGADGVQLIVPDGVVWADGVLPAMTTGKTYEISFVDNFATFLEF